MNIRIIWALLCFIPTASFADTTLSGEGLEKFCSSPESDDRLVCEFIVKAYKDGFIEGVANGAMGTYKFDQQVFTLVKDVKVQDFKSRIDYVVSQSTCVQRVQVEDLIKMYSAYIKQNPSMRSAPYRTAMYRIIQTNYCAK